MINRRDVLIDILLNQSAEYGDRDDAAMDLANFPGEKTEEALLKIACDASSDEDLSDSCGESLAEIWARQDSIRLDDLANMNPKSLKICLATLNVLNPTLSLRASIYLKKFHK